MTLAPYLAVIALAAVSVVADYFIKRSSQPARIDCNLFRIGAAFYSATSFGWLYALRNLKLATVGVVYSISTVILLALVGAIVFHEPLSRREMAGIILALMSLVLLVRFAD